MLAVGVLAAFWLLTVVCSASVASAAATGQSPGPASVKYYIVPQAGRGPANLFEIAAQTLGNGSRFMQIFKLNKGRLQPNGGRLEDPRIIEPGWVLQLPKDANGPGVRFGPLPRPAPSASASPPSGAPSQPAADSSTAVLDVTVASLALLVATTLGVLRVRQARSRSRRRSRDRRTNSRDKAREHTDLPVRLDERIAAPDAIDPADWFGQPNAGWPRDWPADHPSRPQPAVDHHGWPADHPSRPQPAVDHHGWPRDWPADHPSRPQPAVDHHGRPAAPGRSARSSPPLPVRTPGLAGPRPRHPGSALVPRHARTWPPLPAPALRPTTELGDPELGTADALRVVSLLLSEADAEASKMRADAAAAHEQAAARAAAVRDEAERDAETLRASLQALSAELDQLAESVTLRLNVPVKPPTEPGNRPSGPESAVQTAPAPARQPSTRPSAPSKRTSRAAPAARPGDRPRQLQAARMVVAAFIGLLLAGIASGTAEIARHGFSFFVFRSAGTGATPSNGRQKNQGPGQPDAPAAHHHAPALHHRARHHRPASHRGQG